ncbi:MAG: Nucleoside 2-deoxyribosyltransferase [Proteobacteria bacterium]|nr:Nucleoside 2-deoxyribosyltransferase [Pseudomonadota bacterium]
MPSPQSAGALRVYLAGPDIFRPDAVAWAAAARELLAAHGLQALIPIDGEETTASGIYHANLAMIRSADFVLANLNAFRGVEPDSGTCFEAGFAAALGKTVIAYLADRRQHKDKVGHDGGAMPLAADGLRVEDFGLPLNLMLAISCRLVFGDLAAAVTELSTLDVPTPESLCRE